MIALPFLFVTELDAADSERLGVTLLSAPAVHGARVREHGDHALHSPPAGLARGVV